MSKGYAGTNVSTLTFEQEPAPRILSASYGQNSDPQPLPRRDYSCLLVFLHFPVIALRLRPIGVLQLECTTKSPTYTGKCRRWKLHVLGVTGDE